MESLVDALTDLIRACRELDDPRDSSVDLTGAPPCVIRLVEAMTTHTWEVGLMDYSLHDFGAEPVRSLYNELEVGAEGLDLDLQSAMARAGLGGEALDATKTLYLTADPGGMSALGLSWSGALTFVIAELEDPYAGLVTHLHTPGAFLGLVEGYASANSDRSGLDVLEAAAQAAGLSVVREDGVQPAPPEPGASPVLDPTTLPVNRSVAIAQLQAAIGPDAIEAALAQIDRVADQFVVMDVLRMFYTDSSLAPDRALQVTRWLAPKRPDDPTIRWELLKVLCNGCLVSGDPALRRAALDAAVTRGADNPPILHAAAHGYLALGLEDEAVATIEEAAALAYPGFPGLLDDAELATIRDRAETAMYEGRARMLDEGAFAGFRAWVRERGVYPGMVGVADATGFAGRVSDLDTAREHFDPIGVTGQGSVLARWRYEGGSAAVLLARGAQAWVLADSMAEALAILAAVGARPIEIALAEGAHGPPTTEMAPWLSETFGLPIFDDPLGLVRTAGQRHPGLEEVVARVGVA
jgi:hypothetical protein